MDPGERVVGQGDPQRLHAGVNLVDAQVRIAQIGDVILRRIKSIPMFLHGYLAREKLKMRISIVVVGKQCRMTARKISTNGYLYCALHVHGQHFFFAMVLLQSQRFFLFL